MKVYVVFIQNKVYQEIGNVHISREEAEKEAAYFQSQMDSCSFGYSGAVVIERELSKGLNKDE